MAILLRHLSVPMLLTLASAYNQNPKMYVDIECIDFIDPLLHGFDVHLPPNLRRDYLGPYNSPIVYATAIPLNPKEAKSKEPMRNKLYSDRIENSIVNIRDLHAKSWYYVCIEFENMHRDQRQGNTSTSCRLVRTLDPFGKTTSSIVADVGLSMVTDTSMEFFLALDASFPALLDVYLETGFASIRTFHVFQPKSIRVSFNGLSPGQNYGRLCVAEEPLLKSYTAMGRSINARYTACYMEQLWTELERTPAKAFVRSSRGIAVSAAVQSTGKTSFFTTILFAALAFIV